MKTFIKCLILVSIAATLLQLPGGSPVKDVHRPEVAAESTQLAPEIKSADPVDITPKPEPKPEPVVQKPVQPTYAPSGGCEQYRSIVSRYDWDTRLMLAIMQAESGCRSNATGDTSITYYANGRQYGYSVSLLQVRILPGRERCDTHDPAVNIDCAYGIWKGQGYSAWSVYTSGKYRQFYR